MEPTATGPGQAAAQLWYSLIFAPLGEKLGPIGDLVVQAAAKSCSNQPDDAPARCFSALVDEAARSCR